MPLHGILSDFNGTLFFDSEKHAQAWAQFIRYHFHREMTKEENLRFIHGHTNVYILRHLFQRVLDPQENEALSEEKEQYYRMYCAEDRDSFHLAHGAEDFLTYWHEANYPMAVVTASGWSNVAFYLEAFHLDRWFSMDRIVFHDGSFPGKPAPDIYMRAAARLGLSPDQCLVLEDSQSGITSAHDAGAGRIIAIAPDTQWQASACDDWITATIPDFTAFSAQWMR